MLPLPENRIFKGLVYFTTIAVVICYAWLAAHLMEPSFKTHDSVTSAVFFRSSGKLGFFIDVARDQAALSERIMDETDSLVEKFQWLGHLKTPVRIIVDADHVDRLARLGAAPRIEIARLAGRQLGEVLVLLHILFLRNRL